MEPGGPIQAVVDDDMYIKDGDYVVFDEHGDKKALVHIKPNGRAKVGKSYITTGDLIGARWGSTYTLSAGSSRLVPVTDHEPVSGPAVDEVEKDNRDLVDHNTSQALTADDIEAMKASGKGGGEIIEALCKGSTTFEAKTEFAQEKYKRRKARKYLTRLTLRRPTGWTACQVLFDKAPNSVWNLRPDSLALLLSLANVGAGSRCLVLENCQGLVSGAVAERLGGVGGLCCLGTGGKAPPLSVLSQMNLSGGAKSIVACTQLADITDAAQRHKAAGQQAASTTQQPQQQAEQQQQQEQQQEQQEQQPQQQQEQKQQCSDVQEQGQQETQQEQQEEQQKKQQEAAAAANGTGPSEGPSPAASPPAASCGVQAAAGSMSNTSVPTRGMPVVAAAAAAAGSSAPTEAGTAAAGAAGEGEEDELDALYEHSTAAAAADNKRRRSGEAAGGAARQKRSKQQQQQQQQQGDGGTNMAEADTPAEERGGAAAAAAGGGGGGRAAKEGRVRHVSAPKELEELVAVGFNSCIIAAPKLQPASILQQVLPLMAPSSPFVVFSPWVQPLAEAMAALTASRGAVMMQLQESWLRPYQVLPGRTHPHMALTTGGTGGYILSGITVVPDNRPSAAEQKGKGGAGKGGRGRGRGGRRR